METASARIRIKSIRESGNEIVSEISGISAEDATLLERIFGIKTIKELADNKHVFDISGNGCNGFHATILE